MLWHHGCCSLEIHSCAMGCVFPVLIWSHKMSLVLARSARRAIICYIHDSIPGSSRLLFILLLLAGYCSYYGSCYLYTAIISGLGWILHNNFVASPSPHPLPLPRRLHSLPQPHCRSTGNQQATLHPDKPISYEQNRKSHPYMRLTSIWANIELSWVQYPCSFATIDSVAPSCRPWHLELTVDLPRRIHMIDIDGQRSEREKLIWINW